MTQRLFNKLKQIIIHNINWKSIFIKFSNWKENISSFILKLRKSMLFKSIGKILKILAIFLLLVIFDKSLISFILGNVNLIKAFLDNNYDKKELIIFVFYIIFLLNLVIKVIQQLEINLSKVFSSFTIFLICVYYIFIRNNVFQIGEYYIGFSNFSDTNVKYLDPFFVLIALYSIGYIISIAICFSSNELKLNSIWENDKPIRDFSEIQDIYNRTILAKKIAVQINQFSDVTSSFSIGIVGSWGTGKSTFLNQINYELKKDTTNYKTNQIINFNPWQYPDATNLTKAFLREIEIKIQKHSFIDNHIGDYINQLFQNNRSIWSIIINAIFPLRSIENIHESIKESIIKSGKRLVIFIDDIDRLHCNEVFEILTILRNIGDLPNTIFVLAYDKYYLIKTLDDKIKEPQEYLSKFFQVEFELSKILTETLRLNLFKQIDKAFPDLNFLNETLSKSSQNASDFKGNYNLEGLTLLKNNRDLIKLMNSLIIIWPILKSKILFSDFLRLEILRIKYCNVYSKIKYKDPDFINLYGNTYIFTSDIEVRKIPRTDKTLIQKVTHACPKILELLVPDNFDREEIINLLKSLFPIPIQEDDPDNENLSSNDDDLINRAVRNNIIFDYYFQNDFTNITIEELNDLR